MPARLLQCFPYFRARQDRAVPAETVKENYTYKLTNGPRSAGISRRRFIGGDKDRDRDSCCNLIFWSVMSRLSLEHRLCFDGSATFGCCWFGCSDETMEVDSLDAGIRFGSRLIVVNSCRCGGGDGEIDGSWTAGWDSGSVLDADGGDGCEIVEGLSGSWWIIVDNVDDECQQSVVSFSFLIVKLCVVIWAMGMNLKLLSPSPFPIGECCWLWWWKWWSSFGPDWSRIKRSASFSCCCCFSDVDTVVEVAFVLVTEANRPPSSPPPPSVMVSGRIGARINNSWKLLTDQLIEIRRCHFTTTMKTHPNWRQHIIDHHGPSGQQQFPWLSKCWYPVPDDIALYNRCKAN